MGDVSGQIQDALSHTVNPVVGWLEKVGAFGPVDKQLKILPHFAIFYT